MKVLCLGNNSEDTDSKTQQLAQVHHAQCHGLLTELNSSMIDITKEGWYHSSVYDVEYGRLIELALKFDSVVMLDQSKQQYSHPDAFYKTVKLIKSISHGKFINPEYAKDIVFFETLVKTNKSFCIFPFIELLTNSRTDGYTTVCCRSVTPITHVSDISDWKTNKKYQEIRNKMINGIPVPEHCSSCYDLEDKNILSAREQETVEWANRLNLTSIEDLDNITHPSYYEIRPSNICNLQCRMCSPANSHLIGREYKKINLVSKLPPKEKTDFSIVNFDGLKKLYVAGGEPTAMPKFYEFLDRCIEQKQTDFEFSVNTNATKLSERFKKQIKHFKNFQFTVSLDGLDSLNHYIRWPSQWNTIVNNMRYLTKNKHIITINTTFSIYNVLGLCDLLKFCDDEFPGLLIHLNYCGSNNDILSPFNFPDPALAVERLLPIRELNCYRNDRLLKSFVDGIIAHYQTNRDPNLEKLKSFFEFNDKLDRSRNIQLVDYIPELEKTRALI